MRFVGAAVAAVVAVAAAAADVTAAYVGRGFAILPSRVSHAHRHAQPAVHGHIRADGGADGHADGLTLHDVCTHSDSINAVLPTALVREVMQSPPSVCPFVCLFLLYLRTVNFELLHVSRS